MNTPGYKSIETLNSIYLLYNINSSRGAKEFATFRSYTEIASHNMYTFKLFMLGRTRKTHQIGREVLENRLFCYSLASSNPKYIFRKLE